MLPKQLQVKLGGHFASTHPPKGVSVSSHPSLGWGWGQHPCCRQRGQGDLLTGMSRQKSRAQQATSRSWYGGACESPDSIQGPKPRYKSPTALCRAARAASALAGNTPCCPPSVPAPGRGGQGHSSPKAGLGSRGSRMASVLLCPSWGLWSREGNGQRELEPRQC